MALKIIRSAILAAGLPTPRTNELHLCCLNIQRIAIIIITIGPFFDPKPTFDVNRTALRQVFSSILGLLAPKRDPEPRGDVLQFSTLIFSLLIRCHGEAANR